MWPLLRWPVSNDSSRLLVNAAGHARRRPYAGSVVRRKGVDGPSGWASSLPAFRDNPVTSVVMDVHPAVVLIRTCAWPAG